MTHVFPFGKFYGSTRRQVETPAFAFTEVEDFVDSRVPAHTHENAHFLFVLRGKYEATIKGKEHHYSSSTILYYPAGTTHSDHFYTPGGKFLTVSLTSETSRKLIEEMNFGDHSTDLNDSEIAWLGKRISRELRYSDNLSAIILEGMANELLVRSARTLNIPDQPPA